jgi:threonine/homoserine/homoserine lactone efflux protein
MLLSFFKGMAIGFSIAAPVGPIGVLCIRRSLADGRRIGLVTGLGAATADAAYGGIAGFGLTAVSSFLVEQQYSLGLLGGAFLCYLGIRAFSSKPADPAAAARGDSLVTAYLSTLLLTLANPTTILSFVAIFAGLGLGTSSDYLTASTLVLGVFVGSALWWLMLSGGVSMFRSQVSSRWIRAINRLSGVIIFALGVLAFSRLLLWPPNTG